MFSRDSCVLLCTILIIFLCGTCFAEIVAPYLALYSPGDPEYTDVIVRRVGENLTLECEVKGDAVRRIYVWNHVPSNTTDGERPFQPPPREEAPSSRLIKFNLQYSDSGHYMCSATPFSAERYILVQPSNNCARGAFFCGHCVLATYVCDGYPDCKRGEDEAPELCRANVCNRPDKLNCSSGRCISEGACCRSPAPLCRQHSCCDEHPKYSRLEAGWADEYPPLFEDRHAPDEYGFIQSTIYTVTACALIFMIAVVLLVSAICKMHMKRAALRSYTQRPLPLALSAQQMPRFPPCYEASRLLEAERTGIPPSPSAPASPARGADQWRTDCVEEDNGGEAAAGFGLARLSTLFSSRYRQVATECLDVELRAVRASSAVSSPTRTTPLSQYRSPTSCDLNNEYFLHPEVSDCGRDLNYMGVEFYRTRNERPRPLTLQLGRFQLSIPRLGRRRSSDRRPDTPNVAEINIDDLDFVRLNSNETYTLNGRTIRLLGADFENYPVLNDAVRPPPYNEAMRYKLYGPPPEYLSRDALNNEREENTTVTEEQARRNVEMPPCYDELSTNNDNNGNNVITVTVIAENSNTNNTATNDTQSNNTVSDANANNVNNASLSAVIDDLPAIDDVNANGLDYAAVATATNPVVTTDNTVTTTNNPVVTSNSPVATGNNSVAPLSNAVNATNNN